MTPLDLDAILEYGRVPCRLRRGEAMLSRAEIEERLARLAVGKPIHLPTADSEHQAVETVQTLAEWLDVALNPDDLRQFVWTDVGQDAVAWLEGKGER